MAVTPRGLVYRHDPPERDRELKSCPGSLKPVAAPSGDPVLFVSVEDLVMPEPSGLF
ncbi:hypothetical protein AB0D56_36125 [Streptomyces sp. NPDC048209]|uniref:hypothetical protein n=1 Tax=Streptomyces sp. NPDC048209 TaxID=3156689 RepID=UPI00342687B1